MPSPPLKCMLEREWPARERFLGAQVMEEAQEILPLKVGNPKVKAVFLLSRR